MNELPKKRDIAIINKYMYAEILITGVFSSLVCLFYLTSDFVENFFRSSKGNIYLMTGFFALFIFMGIFNAFNSRTTRLNLLSNIDKNKVFIILFGCISIVQLFLIYFGGSLFRTYGLTFKELIFVILLAFSVIPVDLFRKLMFKKRGVVDYI